VFSGGWTLASAEAVGDPEALGLDPLEATTSLVDQSLATTGAAAGGPRFSMLETIREFGREQLAASGELDEVARRHASWFLDLAVAAEPHLGGAGSGTASRWPTAWSGWASSTSAPAGRPPLDFLAGFIGDPEAEARARLPADAAQAAWEEGRRLGVEEALEG
jgi:hypothetical protein